MLIPQDNSEDAPSRFWKAGGDLTGAVTGAVAGLFIAGPPGALMGSGAGVAISTVLKELAHRRLSKREEVRIGATFTYAVAQFKENFTEGQQIRDDGFFTETEHDRSAADEIIEGVLLAAHRQHEERKVEYFGYLLANIAFQPDIDRHLANWAIKIATELTWPQFVLLSMVEQDGNSDLPEVEIGKHNETWGSFGIHQQLIDLGAGERRLIHGESDTTPRMGLKLTNLRLREQKLSSGGRLIHTLMRLDKISKLDKLAVMRPLNAED